MSLAPGDLPLLLAGPVLRRVEADLVCVWIAISQPCNASLLLFDGGDVAASDTPLGDQRAEWVSDVQATLRIGPHLHVLAITLDLRSPAATRCARTARCCRTAPIPTTSRANPIGVFNPIDRGDMRMIE